jgi:hypothetical protein
MTKPIVPVPHPCLCGCGREVIGRVTKKFFNASCKQRYRNRTIKEQAERALVIGRFIGAFRRQYSRLNYEQFCEIIGEPTHHGSNFNRYAQDKWFAFKAMAMSIDQLGIHLNRIIDKGLQDG